jgi:Ser/Thr protein kinase RdoA (MazF antagonist)
MVCVLSWCFTDVLKLERVHAMLDGYESLRSLNDAERDATTTEGMAVCLRFATTRITDFAMRTPPGNEPKRDFNRFLLRYAALQDGVMRRVWGERGHRRVRREQE